MSNYNYNTQEREALDYERTTGIHLERVSDWNTTPQDVVTPLSMYGEAFGKSLASLTFYPETSRTKAICYELRKQLAKRAINIEAMYLYGSGTQALNMTFFALSKRYKGGRVAVIYPGYFSVKASAEALGLTHEGLCRRSDDNFSIPYEHLERLRATCSKSGNSPLCAILITEPVYSCGARLDTSQMKELVSYCKKNNLLLIIDGSFSGLVWDSEPYWQDRDLLNLLHENNVALIESVSKKLFFHNTKIGILYGPRWLVDLATSGADWLTGNITALQQQLAICVFDDYYNELLANNCRQNITFFKERFNKISLAAEGSKYFLYPPRCGYHAMAFTKACSIGSSDPMAWSRLLLKHGVFAIPGHDFGYSDDDYFCFRISLSIKQDIDKILSVFNEVVPSR